MEENKTFEDYLEDACFLDNQWAYTNGAKLITPDKILAIWHYYTRQFQYAYNHCDNDMNIFGHCCKKILTEAGVL